MSRRFRLSARSVALAIIGAWLSVWVHEGIHAVQALANDDEVSGVYVWPMWDAECAGVYVGCAVTTNDGVGLLGEGPALAVQALWFVAFVALIARR